MTITATSPSAPAQFAPGSLPSRVIGRLLGALRDGAPKHPYQRALYVMGALLIASGVAHVGVWLVDGGAWAGPVSWRKPILFGISLGLTCLSLGWVQGTMRYRRVTGWLTTVLIGFGSLAELALITAQCWRGRPSHFNEATAGDEMIFTLMAVSIGLVAIGIVILEVWAIAGLRGPAPTVIAVHVGMVLLLVGCAMGGDLISRGNAYVEANGKVPFEVVIGVAGSGRLAHAVALHSLQVLAVLALLLGRLPGPGAQRTHLMAIAGIGSLALAALVAAQAYAGRSMLDLSLATGLGIAAAVALIGLPFASALLTPDRAVERSHS